MVMVSWYSKGLEYNRERSRIWCELVRLHSFHAYGWVCVCCGEDEMVFLTIDHINGDGAAHRRSLGGGAGATMAFWAWLKRNDYPPGFQTLCRNCNWAKHRLGACPHRM